MSECRDHSHNVSQKLSEVLSDIGVNETMVLKRRRMSLMAGPMLTVYATLTGIEKTSYSFGSQAEGSTTMGLMSDEDALVCIDNMNAIQDWNEWKPGMINLMMIQDETISPGYCLLQSLWSDIPLPVEERNLVPKRHHFIDRRGRVLLGNSILNLSLPAGDAKNGPAFARQGESIVRNIPEYVQAVHVFVIQRLVRNGPAHTLNDHIDIVGACHCKSWPREAQPWLARQGIGGWPTEEMKRYCVDTGCFVVPVGSKSGQNEDLEWRISTVQAERCLILTLNITQLRCYILMKMILKTFINPQINGVISSYMCKTVLFHCVQNTQSHEWQENHLLSCLRHCLLALQNCIKHAKCPHFIIPGNNLMAGRIPVTVKKRLLDIMQYIIQSEGRALLEIPIDDLGSRLRWKMSMMPRNQRNPYNQPEANCSLLISGELLSRMDTGTSDLQNTLLIQLMNERKEIVQLGLSKYILSLVKIYMAANSNLQEKSACRLLTPLLCSSLGSVIASSDIHTNNRISQQAFEWFSAGLNSDVASGRLKLASALYCTGNWERTEAVLRNIGDHYDQNTVEPFCTCHQQGTRILMTKLEFLHKCNSGNEEMIKYIMAFCVKFIRCEIDCIPKELQYEMFRSTEDDRIHRDVRDTWMDWAVVDSLPYLYFLQYKTYGHLQRAEDQQQALANLARTTERDPRIDHWKKNPNLLGQRRTIAFCRENLGHWETALNLLGQCMEQENRYNDALRCYVRSLNIRPRNNAAKIHICRLLNSLVNRHLE